MFCPKSLDKKCKDIISKINIDKISDKIKITENMKRICNEVNSCQSYAQAARNLGLSHTYIREVYNVVIERILSLEGIR